MLHIILYKYVKFAAQSPERRGFDVCLQFLCGETYKQIEQIYAYKLNKSKSYLECSVTKSSEMKETLKLKYYVLCTVKPPKRIVC